MTKDNDGWGTPTEWVPLKHDDGSVAGGYKKETTFGKRPTPVPAANVMLQTQNAAHGMKAMHDKMIADGFTQTGPDMYEKVHTEELIQQWGGDAIAWGAHPDQTSPMTVTPEQWGEYVERNYNDDGSGNLTAKREPEINVGGTLNFFHDDSPRAEYVEGPDAWPVNPEDAGEDGDNDPDLAYRSTNESMWGDDPAAEVDLTDMKPVTSDWDGVDLTAETPLDAPLYYWHAESGSGVIAETEEQAERYASQGLDEVSAETYQRFIDEEEIIRQLEADVGVTATHTAMRKEGFEWAHEDNAYFNADTGLYVKPDDVGDFLALAREHTYNDTDADRARAANACMEIDPQTPWVVDVPDGELTLKEDYMSTVTTGEETGIYIAYSQGILHAVLAGPYPDLNHAATRVDEVWQRFQNDGAFALAFDKAGWNRAGVYMAEIPLKARRKGAYGPI